MERNLDTNPYSEDELRVVQFLADRGCGAGDDPIGFLLASYAYLIEQRNELLLEKKNGNGKEEGRL